MTDDDRWTREEFHARCAKNCFNAVWKLMEKPQRTPDEDDAMIHMAHASRFHWGKTAAGMPAHHARGEWQVSRVYRILRRAEPALHHARRCLALAQEHALGDFDLACGHEAMAQALALAGRIDDARRHCAEGRAIAARIDDAEDRAIVEADLGMVPVPG